MQQIMTFDEWVRNPSDSRTRLVGETDIARAVYNDKYNKMMLACAGKINYYLFHEDTKRYVIYIQMPSEKVKGLTYDVVIEFRAEDDVKRRINNLNGYHVRFFANDPNFVFTYAYTYNKYKLIIPELMNKISIKAIKEKPKTTNPNTMVGYVKSIYFAYIFMRNRGLFNKLNWLNAGSINQMHQFFNANISHSDVKLKQAQDLPKILKAAENGTKVKVSQSDPRALDKAATKVSQMTNFAKRTKAVSRDIQSRSSIVKTTKYVKRG